MMTYKEEIKNDVKRYITPCIIKGEITKADCWEDFNEEAYDVVTGREKPYYLTDGEAYAKARENIDEVITALCGWEDITYEDVIKMCITDIKKVDTETRSWYFSSAYDEALDELEAEGYFKERE